MQTKKEQRETYADKKRKKERRMQSTYICICTYEKKETYADICTDIDICTLHTSLFFLFLSAYVSLFSFFDRYMYADILCTDMCLKTYM